MIWQIDCCFGRYDLYCRHVYPKSYIEMEIYTLPHIWACAGDTDFMVTWYFRSQRSISSMGRRESPDGTLMTSIIGRSLNGSRSHLHDMSQILARKKLLQRLTRTTLLLVMISEYRLHTARMTLKTLKLAGFLCAFWNPVLSALSISEMIWPEDLVMSIIFNLRKSLVQDTVNIESVVKA